MYGAAVTAQSKRRLWAKRKLGKTVDQVSGRRRWVVAPFVLVISCGKAVKFSF